MSSHSAVEVAVLSARLNGFRLPMGLVISLVEVQGKGLFIQKRPFVIRLSEPGSFEAHVTDADLADFLNGKSPGGLKGFKVSSSKGVLTIEAVKSMLVEVPVKATCHLRIHQGQQLFVELESVEVMGAGAKNLVKSQLDKINPVLDMAEFPVDGSLLSVNSDAGVTILRGEVAPKG